MKYVTIAEMYDLDQTIARELFEGKIYPWEVLPLIKDFIPELGKRLPEEEYERAGETIWIARDAKVAPTASINGPCIIGRKAEIRQCAFIRGNAIVGDNAVVGNSTELKMWYCSTGCRFRTIITWAILYWVTGRTWAQAPSPPM